MHKLFLYISLIVASFSITAMAAPMASASQMSNSAVVVVQTIPGQSLAQEVVTRASSSWPWYLVRGAGIIAAISLVILMLSGIGSITGHTFKILEPITAWASHRALGIIFGLSVLVYMIALLFDHFIPFDIPSILVPWLSSYKPVTLFGIQFGSLFIALGILAFYIIAISIVVSILWIEKKPKIWKLTHLLTYIATIFVFIHALYLGTDLADGIPRLLWIAAGIIIVVATVYRFWISRSITK